MNKFQYFVSVSEVVLRNKQGKLQAGKRGWHKFKWPELDESPRTLLPIIIFFLANVACSVLCVAYVNSHYLIVRRSMIY